MKLNNIIGNLLIAAFCVAFCNATFGQSAANQIKQGQPILTHQVYFWLKPNLSAEQIATFEKGLKSLLAVKTVKYGDVGRPADTPKRPVIDNSYSYALILMYENVAAHDAYQVDPLHEQFLKDCSQLWTNVQVYDSFSIK